MILYQLSYLLIRFFGFFLSLLNYKALHNFSFAIAPFLFRVLKNYRKRSLSNLALAKTLNLSNEEIEKTAVKSLASLLMTALEYPKLATDSHLEKLVKCVNPQTAEILRKDGKAIVFFCAHQANWELLFLEYTMRGPCMAIGKPVKNPYLYNWVLSIRERFGGTIIPPKNALKESLRALKKGTNVGIVGDQGMPDSGFSSIFLGRLAWTSPLPAILSYRTESPLMFALTKREDNGTYTITYSDPVFPDTTKPADEEIARLTNHCLTLLEKSIQKYPDQWLWQHNRWKQKLPGALKKPFRQDAIAIILPPEENLAQEIASQLQVFRTIYPTEWIMVMAPRSCSNTISIKADETFFFDKLEDCYIKHYGPKLIFNFTNEKKLNHHFLKLSAFSAFDVRSLCQEAGVSYCGDLDNFIRKATGYAQ